ncbi:hypothetical protein AcW1_009578 [Taiwanofungus camphoratus]|nr:hypothetical protein AcV5_002520 [Antrodia cinnamomea]KAI0947948.1 hypothetical protein AcW1_009578 [Antrodia cinnamomea]
MYHCTQAVPTSRLFSRISFPVLFLVPVPSVPSAHSGLSGRSSSTPSSSLSYPLSSTHGKVISINQSYHLPDDELSEHVAGILVLIITDIEEHTGAIAEGGIVSRQDLELSYVNNKCPRSGVVYYPNVTPSHVTLGNPRTLAGCTS